MRLLLRDIVASGELTEDNKIMNKMRMSICDSIILYLCSYLRAATLLLHDKRQKSRQARHKARKKAASSVLQQLHVVSSHFFSAIYTDSRYIFVLFSYYIFVCVAFLLRYCSIYEDTYTLDERKHRKSFFKNPFPFAIFFSASFFSSRRFCDDEASSSFVRRRCCQVFFDYHSSISYINNIMKFLRLSFSLLVCLTYARAYKAVLTHLCHVFTALHRMDFPRFFFEIIINHVSLIDTYIWVGSRGIFRRLFLVSKFSD